MRELTRDATVWRVREVETTHVPGARGDHCLIFESEAIVRRVWTYPAEWAALPDEQLWMLLDAVQSRATPARRAATPIAYAPTTGPDHTEIAQRTRSLLAELRILREANSALRDERRVLLQQCQEARGSMHEAVVAYVAHMRREGVPPERALVLLKQAVQEGMTGVPADEPIVEELMQDGARWCIDAYYAA